MIDHHPFPAARPPSLMPHASPLLATGGRVAHALPRRSAHADGATIDVVLRNGSPTRRAELALALERRRREAFVSTLAHELRQPLSAVLMAVEGVRLAPERAAEIIKRQIGQMNRLIEDLIDSARWARGKVTIQRQRLDVREVARNAAMDTRSAVVERGHEFVVAAASEPLWVDADPQRLQQVLTNLLLNAARYTDQGGRITLAASRSAATVTVRVSDTGCGIEPEALGHIFDLFSQVQPFQAAGLGIGLSVVREIVTLHGGRIEARSQGQGRGSEFIVTLPLASPPAASQSVA
jgi:signal transduction histidine kinase